MYFDTFIDADSDWLDTAFFSQTAYRYPLHIEMLATIKP